MKNGGGKLEGFWSLKTPLAALLLYPVKSTAKLAEAAAPTRH